MPTRGGRISIFSLTRPPPASCPKRQTLAHVGIPKHSRRRSGRAPGQYGYDFLRTAASTQGRTPARATRAADEILATVGALRSLPREPKTGPPGSPETLKSLEWDDKKDSLLDRIEAQALLIPEKDLRERLAFIAMALRHPSDLAGFAGFRETQARYYLCMEALDCLGAYYRGEPLPAERQTTTQARAAIEDAIIEYRDEE